MSFSPHLHSGISNVYGQSIHRASQKHSVTNTNVHVSINFELSTPVKPVEIAKYQKKKTIDDDFHVVADIHGNSYDGIPSSFG